MVKPRCLISTVSIVTDNITVLFREMLMTLTRMRWLSCLEVLTNWRL